jgi:HlyD family secretion protein
MDRIIEKKNSFPKKIASWILITAVGIVLIYLVVSATGNNALRIAQSRIQIGEVVFGDFQDAIPIQATVEPLTSVVITTPEGGNIDEIFVEDGIMVEKGDPLIKLTNSSLMLDFMNRETQIIEQVNNLRNTRLSLEENKRLLEQQWNQTSFDLKEAKLQFSADSGLFADSAIAVNEYKSSRNRLNFLKDQAQLMMISMKREAEKRELQLNSIDQSIHLMERNLKAIQKTLDNLTIKAPISGQLTSFNPQLGESKLKGESIGTINVMEGYKAEAFIDEYYLSRVKVGQVATYIIGSKVYELEIRKVIPEVQNGQFEAHLYFTGDLPSNITRGQTLNLKLAMSNLSKRLMVPSGGFYQSTGGSWVFVFDGKNSAVKREVKLGRRNPEFIEVLEGLKEGERVIINSYSTYGETEKIELKN